MPGWKDNVNLNYLLFLFFLTKWISQPVFLSFARQEPDCTFQPKDLVRSSSSSHSSFCFSLSLIIFQPGLLAAPILKITSKDNYEQPGEQLGCCKALHHCQSKGCPFQFNQLSALDLTHYIPLAVGGSPATGSVLPNFSKFLGACGNVFPFISKHWCISLMWIALNFGIVSERFGPPGCSIQRLWARFSAFQHVF